MANRTTVAVIGGVMGLASLAGIALLSATFGPSGPRPAVNAGVMNSDNRERESRKPQPKAGIPDELQATIQAVMDDVTLTKEREVVIKGEKHVMPPTFGMGRVIRPSDLFWRDGKSDLIGIDLTLTETQKGFHSLLAKLRKENDVFKLYWRASHKTEASAVPFAGVSYRLMNGFRSDEAEDKKLVAALTRSVNSGRNEDFSDGGMNFATRPLVLSSKSCLNCHQDMKVGDKPAYIGIIWKSKILPK